MTAYHSSPLRPQAAGLDGAVRTGAVGTADAAVHVWTAVKVTALAAGTLGAAKIAMGKKEEASGEEAPEGADGEAPTTSGDANQPPASKED